MLIYDMMMYDIINDLLLWFTFAGTGHFAILDGTTGGGGVGWFDPPRIWLQIDLESWQKPAC